MRPVPHMVFWVHRDACSVFLLERSWLSSRQGLRSRQALWGCDPRINLGSAHAVRGLVMAMNAMRLLWTIACMIICAGCVNGADQMCVGDNIQREGCDACMQPHVAEAGQ